MITTVLLGFAPAGIATAVSVWHRNICSLKFHREQQNWRGAHAAALQTMADEEQKGILNSDLGQNYDTYFYCC